MVGWHHRLNGHGDEVLREPLMRRQGSQVSMRVARVKSVMPSNHFILCRPLLLLPPISPSIRVFSPQLEKNHVVPTSWQDEALARHGV